MTNDDTNLYHLHRRIKRLSEALNDVLNVFKAADKAGPNKTTTCTADRQEMWEKILRECGSPLEPLKPSNKS